MNDLPAVQTVLENPVECAPEKWYSAGTTACLAYAYFAHDFPPVQFSFEPVHAFQVQIEAIDQSHALRLGGIHAQLALVEIIAERDGAPHPHAFAFGGGD